MTFSSSTPTTSEYWSDRNAITADDMNKNVRDIHRFLVNPPSCRLSVKQNGSATSYQTTASGWSSFYFAMPKAGQNPTREWDTSGGQMATADANGFVRAIKAPTDGIYAITFSGMFYTKTVSANNNSRIGKNITTDANWNNTYGPFAAMSPVKTPLTTSNQYAVSHTSIARLWKDDGVSVGVASDNSQYTGDATTKGFISMTWIGGMTSDYYANA
ncbi:hypothetical protein [Streptomyces sp. H39-S7]|uniref:hypothetical protein n=1 Tax=Streptomyces sp. H39-S7 TaxID=3004357 RepID=UPI0022AEAD7B|nr:hypothetical protein [Streptomyces sp. H39-S7]MCZ4119045.1 hypothetical protein [Streptomyces sp. H39-S7]